MRHLLSSLFLGCLFCAVLYKGAATAAAKPHVITFGKWTNVQWLPDSADNQTLTLKARALIVDGRVKEYVLGSPHEVTDRLFVARRVFRVNDSLPEDLGPRWQWQPGGWLLVDRTTGRISAINLPDFDAFYSPATWYRDYVAYGGIADDGKKLYAVVAQLGRRKPILKKLLSNDGVPDHEGPDTACRAPSWQRSPMRVSFEPSGMPKETFAIRGHVVDLVNDAEEEDEASK